jgi:hypothetical protein
LLLKSIDRIEAGSDLRAAQITARAQSPDLMKELFGSLRDQVGLVIEIDRGKQAMKAEKTDRTALMRFAAKYGKAV